MNVIEAITLTAMLILLPPSEGKTAPESGEPFDFHELVFPNLSGERRTILQELEVVSSLPNAHEVLKVGKSLAADIAANQHLIEAPAAPAWHVYTGVLFDALDYETLEQIDDDCCLVFSALFGVTRLSDAIPSYRFPATAKLPGIGNVGTWWRERLTDSLDSYSKGPIIDCRSTTYRSFWKAPPVRTVTIDVFQWVDGELKVVSHWAKQARGYVARKVLQAHSQQPVESLDQVAEVVRDMYETELVPPTAKKAGSLRIILNS